MPRGLNLHIFGIRSIYRFDDDVQESIYTVARKKQELKPLWLWPSNPVNADSLWINRNARKSIEFKNRGSSCWNCREQFIRKSIARIVCEIAF